MPYCSVDDLKNEVFLADVFELTKPANSSSFDYSLTPDQLSLLNDIFGIADNEINDFCRSKYVIPFNPVPGSIRDIAVSISVYRLFSRSGDLEADHPKRIRFTDAINRLKLIMNGDIALDAALISDESVSSGIFSNKSSASCFFSKSFLDKMP